MSVNSINLRLHVPVKGKFTCTIIIHVGLNHMAAMLSPEGLKTPSQTFQLEARGKKSIIYGQYGHHMNKAHLL